MSDESKAVKTLVTWAGWPTAPAPIAAVRAAGKPVVVTDESGKTIPFGTGMLLRELVRGIWLRLLDGLIGALAWTIAGRRAPPVRDRDGNRTGPVVLVLPVLPDLSHTFVYREVLAILKQRPDWRVIVLGHNPKAPVHSEAEALAKISTFLPRDGVTRRAVRLLAWLTRTAGRELFALYRAQVGGSVSDLLGKNPLRDSRHPGNAFVLADTLASIRPRELHVYSSTYAANVAMGAAHLLGIPLSISSYVDFEFPYAHRMLGEKLSRARFFRVVTSFCSERLREMPDASELPPERVTVIYLGLDLCNWQERAQPSGEGVLVSAARLVPKKGLVFVPPALARIRARNIPVRWRVLGDGPELPSLKQACEDHGVTDLVTFLGPRDNATVRSELAAADVALLPCIMADDGERDGIPIFLCEAMALGVPVVTTPISGIPELVRDNDTGFLCPPEDSEALADKLLEVLSNPDHSHAIGMQGRNEVRATLNVDDKAAQLVARIEA